MTSQLPASYPTLRSAVNQTPSEKHRPRLRALAKVRLSHPSSYQVAMYRSGCANADHVTHVSQSTVARELGIAEKTVRRADAELIAVGWMHAWFGPSPYDSRRTVRYCRMNYDFGDDRTWPSDHAQQDHSPTPIFRKYEGGTELSPGGQSCPGGGDRAVPEGGTELSVKGTPSKEPHEGGDADARARVEISPPSAAPLSDPAAPDPDAARLMESWQRSREEIGAIGRPDPAAAQRILDQLPPEPERRKSALEKVERAMAYLARHPHHGPRVTTLDKLASNFEALIGEVCAKAQEVRDGPRRTGPTAEEREERETLARKARMAVLERTRDMLAANRTFDTVDQAPSLELARRIAEKAING